MTKTLDGRVALVTGAGRGIGAAVAKRLAAAGAAVVVNDYGVTLAGAPDTERPADAVVRDITEAGGRAIANIADVSDFAAAEGMVRAGIDEWGRFDILVNVAGIIRDRMIWNMTPEEWRAVVDVHLTGTFNTSRHAATWWREQGDVDEGRRVINFTSASGLYGSTGQPNYSAAKLGIVGLTYTCANSLARMGVACTAVSPSADTRMTPRPADPDDAHARALRSPDNTATVVEWLAGPSSSWCTGQIVGARGFDVTLYGVPRPVARLHAGAPWEVSDLEKQADAQFRPLIPAGPTWPPAEVLSERAAAS